MENYSHLSRLCALAGKLQCKEIFTKKNYIFIFIQIFTWKKEKSKLSHEIPKNGIFEKWPNEKYFPWNFLKGISLNNELAGGWKSILIDGKFTELKRVPLFNFPFIFRKKYRKIKMCQWKSITYRYRSVSAT